MAKHAGVYQGFSLAYVSMTMVGNTLSTLRLTVGVDIVNM